MNAVTFAAGFMLGAISIPFGLFLLALVAGVRATRRESQAERDRARFVKVMRQEWETR